MADHPHNKPKKPRKPINRGKPAKPPTTAKILKAKRKFIAKKGRKK